MTDSWALDGAFLERLARATLGDGFRESSLQAGLTAQASAAPAPPPKASDAASEAALDRAAIVGSFRPADIVRDVAPAERAQALSPVAPQCDITPRAGERRWVLRRGVRRQRLADLWADGDRRAAAMSSVKHRKDDDAGRYLTSILRDRALPAMPRTAARMRALLQALDWLGQGLPEERYAADLRLRLARVSIRESFGDLLKNGFFGRQREVAEFQEFLDTPAGGTVPVLAISGIGGAGKSTYLAFLAQDLLDRRKASGGAMALAVDFDRFGFGPNSLLELTFELTRQIALHEPALTDPLKELRRRIRRMALEQVSVTAYSDANLESARSVSDDLWRYCVEQLGEPFAKNGLTERDIVLFLDTFERAQTVRVEDAASAGSGEAASSRIGVWIETLASWADLRGLRVVVSGRAAVEPASVLGRHVVKTIRLTDLETDARLELLASLDVAAELAPALAAAIGGNPLLLRIGARLVRRLDEPRRQELLRDLSATAGTLGAEVVQAFLYDRVLSHIGDPRVEKLAHPGLAVRVVTWRLIRDVLAGPCGLGTATDEESRRLLDALADQVWLVDRRGAAPDWVLEHRHDIRSLMLRMMSSEPAAGAGAGRAAKVREIHERAAEYHARNADPDLDAVTARREAAYHRILLGDSQLGDDDLRLAGPTLGDDMRLVPSSMRTRVKLVLGEPLQMEDAEAAPDDEWRVFSLREGRARLFDHDDPVAALAVFARRPPPQPAERPSWYLRAVDTVARWDELAPAELDAVQSMLGPDAAKPPQARGTELLAASGSLDPKTRRLLAEDLLDRPAALFLLRFKRREYREAFEGSLAFLENQDPFNRLFEGDAVQGTAVIRALTYVRLAMAAARIHGQELDPTRWDRALSATESIRSARREDPVLAGELQRFSALTSGRQGLVGPFLTLAPRTFVPDPAWLEALHQGLEGLAPDNAEALSRFNSVVGGRVEKGMTSSDLLGPTAVEFTALYGEVSARGILPRPLPARLLTGDRREFRPSARYALRTAFPTATDLKRLAEIAWSLLPWKPIDLEPARLSSTDPKAAVSRLVDYLDASLRLGELLRAASDERPEAQPLRLTSEALSRWDQAFEASTPQA